MDGRIDEHRSRVLSSGRTCANEAKVNLCGMRGLAKLDRIRRERSQSQFDETNPTSRIAVQNSCAGNMIGRHSIYAKGSQVSIAMAASKPAVAA